MFDGSKAVIPKLSVSVGNSDYDVPYISSVNVNALRFVKADCVHKALVVCKYLKCEGMFLILWCLLARDDEFAVSQSRHLGIIRF